MFIEQLKTKPVSLLKYLPFPLMFFAFMGFNYVATLASDINTNEVIEKMISQLGKNVTFVITVIPLSMLCLFLLFWVKIFHKQTITSLTTGRSKIDFKRIVFSFSLWAIFLITVMTIQYLMSPSDFKVIFNPIPFIILLVLAVILIPLQTSFEEYLFRGYLMQGLGLATKNKWFPLVFTSVFFGLLHIANPEVDAFGYEMLVFYIGTGFFLGIITLMDEGMELALGFHAANNLIGALLVTSKDSAFQTNAILEQVSTSNSLTEIYIQVFVIFPILLLIYSKKFGWNDWKRKLIGKI